MSRTIDKHVIMNYKKVGGDFMEAKLNGDQLTITMTLEKGKASKSGKSLLVFTTKGFRKVEGTDIQVSINVIKGK